MKPQLWHSNHIQVTTEPLSPIESEAERVNLTIDAAKLMALIQAGHLVASDIHCLGNCSKQCVRSMLLKCVRCKMHN